MQRKKLERPGLYKPSVEKEVLWFCVTQTSLKSQDQQVTKKGAGEKKRFSKHFLEATYKILIFYKFSIRERKMNITHCVHRRTPWVKMHWNNKWNNHMCKN